MCLFETNSILFSVKIGTSKNKTFISFLLGRLYFFKVLRTGNNKVNLNGLQVKKPPYRLAIGQTTQN